MLLREKHKKALIDIFSTSSLPIEVWAYGSRVNGSAHNGSDLDLVAFTEGKSKLPSDLFLNLKEKITESNIPILVDLFDWARLPENFKSNIEAQHEVLFSSLPGMANENKADYEGNPDQTEAEV